MLTLRLLTTSDVEDLWPRLRLEDQEETIVLGSNPREALLMGAFDNMFVGISKGRAYAIETPGGDVIGAIGFTSTGYLWALSTRFNPAESRELFRRTPEIAFKLLYEAVDRGAIPSDGTLGNYIHAKNKPALRWLKASKCFDIDEEKEVDAKGETFYTFHSKPMDDVLSACASPFQH